MHRDTVKGRALICNSIEKVDIESSESEVRSGLVCGLRISGNANCVSVYC